MLYVWVIKLSTDVAHHRIQRVITTIIFPSTAREGGAAGTEDAADLKVVTDDPLGSLVAAHILFSR